MHMLDTGHEICFLLLCLLSLSIWFKNKKSFLVPFFFAAMGIGLYLNMLTLSGAFFILAFFLLCFLSERVANKKLRFVFYTLIATCMILVVMKKIPWFNSFSLFTDLKLSPHSRPYSLRMHIGQLMGVIAAYFYIKPAHNLSQWKRAFKDAFVPLIIIIIVLMGPALLTNFIKFEPKFPYYETLFFALTNLLLICFTEEVFFRGFIQNKLREFLPGKSRFLKFWAPILLTSIIFGFVHMGAGPLMVAFATIAGIAYGYAYYKSGRIEAAILTHFGLNFVHFIFFTYPSYSSL